MNKRLLSIILTPVIVISLCLFAQHVGGGLIHHHVKVTNTTSNQAQITLRTFDGHTQQTTVAPGQQYTFDTGVKCPRALNGEMDKYNPSFTHKIQILGACTNNGSPYTSVSDCSLSCKSSNFRLICQPRNIYDGVACYFVKD